MFLGLFILTRVLFVACMVFIIGYIFGGFSKNRNLTTLARVAAILIIVLFISVNIQAIRYSGRDWAHHGLRHECGYHPNDSSSNK